MPVLFVHGTSVRRKKDDPRPYDRNVAARDDLMRRFLLDPLGRGGYKIYNPYVGAVGVELAWNGLSIPQPNVIQDLSGESESDAATNALHADGELLGQVIGDTTARPDGRPQEGDMREAFARDPEKFMEAVFAPIIRGAQPIGGVDAAQAGAQTAALLVAARAAALDPQIQARAKAAPSDDALLKILQAAVEEKFKSGDPGPLDGNAPPPGAAPPGLEHLGWWDDLSSRVGEIFDRAKNVGFRAGSLTVMGFKRDGASRLAARFLGDIFLYLRKPPPAQKMLLDTLKTGGAAAPGEPWILIAHSLGGQMLYDTLVSRKADLPPGLKIDALITVGSQIGAFEEMKLLQSSDAAIRYPQTLTMPPGVSKWINIYDPNDFLGFNAAPLWPDCKDISYSTGGATPIDTHSDYFLRPTFWDIVRKELKA